MDEVIVLKDVAYAAKQGGGTVDNIEEVDTLVKGAMGFYNEKGELINVAADLLDSKQFRIGHHTKSEGMITKSYTRRSVYRFINEDYAAPVYHKVVIGTNADDADSLPIEAEDVGHVGIRIADNTFSSRFATDVVNATVYKRRNTTPAQVIASLVEQLNNAKGLDLTAEDISDGGLGLTVQSNTRGQVITVALSGLIELGRVLNDGTGASTLPNPGTGVGEDVLRMEEEASVFKGNMRSVYRGDQFYKDVFAAQIDTNYSAITFQEDLPHPYGGETNVKPIVHIFFPEDAEDLEVALIDVTKLLIGEAFTGASNAEPADDDQPEVVG